VILADASVWIDHLRRGNAELRRLLEEERVACHPFVIGELALGRLRNRQEILSLLEALQGAPEARHGEVLHFVEIHGLAGAGIGWVDAHLLCSAALGGHRLWTLDRPLVAAARKTNLGV
jgi:predicted nucleic acid-binding protein